MITLSEKINSIEESKTVQFTPLIERLKQQGKPVFNFAVGEPQYQTSDLVIADTKKALDEGHTRYTAVPGLPELRSGLAEKYPGYNSDNIIVSNGSKQSLFLIFQVILNTGDEVIIPKPYWVSFAQQVKMAGATPVFVDTVRHQLDLDAIRRCVTARTRAIIINSPNNPTGAVYPEEDLGEVVRLATQKNLFIISDEAYGFFVYDNIPSRSLFDIAQDKDRLIVTGSFSKQYHMTGFRIGYIAAHQNLVKAIAKYQGHASGNVCTFAQYGAIAALKTELSVLTSQRADLEKKRDLTWQCISALFDCIRPQGAFYIFPDISRRLKQGETASDFASDLLEKTGVAVVPGEAFGMPGHIRISYAVDQALLIEGLTRIKNYIGLK